MIETSDGQYILLGTSDGRLEIRNTLSLSLISLSSSLYTTPSPTSPTSSNSPSSPPADTSTSFSSLNLDDLSSQGGVTYLTFSDGNYILLQIYLLFHILIYFIFFFF